KFTGAAPPGGFTRFGRCRPAGYGWLRARFSCLSLTFGLGYPWAWFIYARARHGLSGAQEPRTLVQWFRVACRTASSTFRRGVDQVFVESVMDKTVYVHIRDALSFRRRYLPTILFLLADLGLFVFGLWLLTLENTWAYVGSQFLFAMIFFHNFALLHECGHETATPSGLF